MATHVVTVDLQVKKRGSIVIKVDPWEVHSKLGDTVSWNFTGDITKGSVEPESKRRVWPFAGRLPPLKGTKARNARTGKRTAHPNASKIVSYRVILEFRDPTDGHIRSATVDPDMVID